MARVGVVLACLLLCACNGDSELNSSYQAPEGEKHPVVIQPTPTPAGVTTATGESVSCSSCHATRQPNKAHGAELTPERFHQGLHFAHGGLSCASCHKADNYDMLGLADGTALPFNRAMDLCAQCHGPQYRDYRNGSHGGMTGYWDLTRGGRTRNSCLACHDVHAPAYPKMMPAPPPVDAVWPEHKESSHE